MPYTIPANNVAAGHTGFFADQNNTADVLTGFGAAYSALNTAYADGADPTGSADSTAAFAAAIAALPAAGGQITAPPGTYALSGSGLTFGRNQGMICAGRGATKFVYTGTGTAITVFDSSFSSSLSFGGRFNGFTIDGTGAGASATGMSWGNLGTARCSDIEIKNFTGASAVGLKFKNGTTNVNWSEEAEWTGILVSNNTVNVLFDTGSFDYSLYQFVVQANSGQDGIAFQNDASLEGVRFELRGNFKTGAGNTAAVMAFDRGNAAGTSRIDGQVFVSVECDGTTGTGHFTLLMQGSSSSKFVGTGVLEFLDETISFQGASIVTAPGPQLGFSGRVVDHLLGKMIPGDALAVQGGSQWTEFGSLATAFPATIFLKSGDIQAFRLANGANTAAFSGNLDRARRIDLFLAQPASGAKGTVTWPGNVVWPGGTAPVLKANNGAVDRFRLIYLPSETAWYGEMLGAKAAPAAFLPANPASTVSQNIQVMMGLGSTCAYTPAGTGLVQVTITGYGNTSASAFAFTVGPQFGTGTAPANGAGLTGTLFGCGAAPVIKVPGTTGNTAFSFTAQVQLVTGTAYWFDLSLSTTNSTGAASISSVSMTIQELA